MTDTPKTAAMERAEKFAKKWELTAYKSYGLRTVEFPEDVAKDIKYRITKGFDAGRKDFIENDLPKLLEMARDTEFNQEFDCGCVQMDLKYTIEQILEQAKKLW